MSQQDQNNQVLLKSRFFGGFDKRQVLTHIDDLHTKNIAACSELEERIAEMSAARGALASQVGQFEKTISELETQLAERSAHIREMTGVIDSLKTEVTQKDRQRDEAERALLIQKEQNRQLAMREQELEEMSSYYSEMTKEIGGIVLEAKQNAVQVVEEAKQNAAQVVEEAHQRALEREQEINGTTLRVIGEMRSLRSELDAVRQNVEALVDSFFDGVDLIDEAIESIERRAAGQVIGEASVERDTVVGIEFGEKPGAAADMEFGEEPETAAIRCGEANEPVMATMGFSGSEDDGLRTHVRVRPGKNAAPAKRRDSGRDARVGLFDHMFRRMLKPDA